MLVGLMHISSAKDDSFIQKTFNIFLHMSHHITLYYITLYHITLYYIIKIFNIYARHYRGLGMLFDSMSDWFLVSRDGKCVEIINTCGAHVTDSTRHNTPNESHTHSTSHICVFSEQEHLLWQALFVFKSQRRMEQCALVMAT